jgi:hypothetical protein
VSGPEKFCTTCGGKAAGGACVGCGRRPVNCNCQPAGYEKTRINETSRSGGHFAYEKAAKEVRINPVGDVPVADLAMFTGTLGAITEAAAPSTEADPAGIYGSLMAGTGALIGRGPYVQVGNVRHPLLIWPLLLGRTGAGRKDIPGA